MADLCDPSNSFICYCCHCISDEWRTA